MKKYCEGNHTYEATIVPQMEFALNTSIASAHGLTPLWLRWVGNPGIHSGAYQTTDTGICTRYGDGVKGISDSGRRPAGAGACAAVAGASTISSGGAAKGIAWECGAR